MYPTNSADVGFYSVVGVRLPGKQATRMGVILVDHRDQVYIKFSELLFTTDLDALEVWTGLLDDFPALASDLGGLGLLRWLDENGSHFIQVEPITACTIDDPERNVEALFKRLVVNDGKDESRDFAKELGLFRFSPAALNKARQMLPNASANCLHVIQAYRSGETGIEKLEKFLNRDPGMAAQIIRIANLGKTSHGLDVRSIRQALIQVGTDTALGVVMAYALRPLYSSPMLQAAWVRCLRIRDTATRIGKFMKSGRPDEVGLMGLLADLGKVVLLNLIGYESFFNQLRVLGYPVLNCELMLCGTTHAEIGAEILGEWSFPSDIIDAVRHHHSPSRSTTIESAIIFVAEASIPSPDTVCDIEEFYASSARLKLTPAQCRELAAYKPDLESLLLG